MINYILKYTYQDALHYIGHSQGTTAFFVMLSMLPQYNSKILSAYLLSPIAYISHVNSPLVRNLVDMSDTLEVI